jgi:adenylate cyclase
LKQHIVRIALGLAVVLVFVVHAAKIGNFQIGLVNQLDNIIYDTRLKLTMPGTVDDRIVILDIDEHSLDSQALGHWPWSRDKIVALLKKLFDKYGVSIIGFDVVFAEPDQSSGLPVLEKLARSKLKDVPRFQSALNELRPELDYDALFARFLRSRPVVLGYYFNSEENAVESGALPEPVLPAGTFAGRKIKFFSWKGYGGNLPELQANAADAGHFIPRVDDDGVSRRVLMLIEYKGNYYEALSLAVVRLYLGQQDAVRNNRTAVTLPKVVPGFAPERFVNKGYSGLEWLDVAGVRIPVDDEVATYVPYRGQRGSFPYVSLADVWSDKVPVEKLRGKIALIGTSAPGLLDLRSTPVDSVYPGVEIHANLIAGMLDGKLKQKPPYILGAEVLLLIVGGVVLSILVPLLSPLRASLVSLVALLLITGLNLAVWSWASIVLPLAASLLMTVALFALNMSYGYFVESRSKRQFTELFGQYVPPELVDKMAEDPEKYSMEGKREDLTVLFSDVRGFTTISESLDPQNLSAYINEYLTTMSLVIRDNRGTLDKYIGDAIMAFWGAPVADPGHHRNGVMTAMHMQRKALELNEEFRKRGWPEFKIGIGLNSGVMSVGDMGSKVRKAYTVMGDPVNLGSRLEGITKQYGVGILVGENTRKGVQDVVFREVDRVRVKGKDEPVAIFEPIGVDGEVDKAVLDELKLWNQVLKLYRAQDWEKAELQLLNLQRMNPGCELYRVFSEKITDYRANPPGPGWDGVTKFETK